MAEIIDTRGKKVGALFAFMDPVASAAGTAASNNHKIIKFLLTGFQVTNTNIAATQKIISSK